MRAVSDAVRRARIARRHALAPGHRLTDPVAVTRAMTVLHATEPPSVHLAVAARADGVDVAAVEAALYDDRSLVKQLAMRRTLFVFTRDLLGAAWGSASARVAGAELRRLAGDVERSGVAADGSAWVESACAAALEHLRAQDPDAGLDAATLRAEVPHLAVRIVQGSGRWAQDAPAAPRVLTLLGARGAVVRGRNAGHWRISRPRWTPSDHWLGAAPDRDADSLTEEQGYAELVRRWLWTFGPGTEADLVWWLGATKTAVRRAVADVGAVEVALDSGAVGLLLPDDPLLGDGVEPDPGDWAALLPTLDPTTMGWRDRDFYLDPADVPYLFDTSGNGGTTAWWNGRIVGCWVQEPDGEVRVVLRREVAATARKALDTEAGRLTDWLGGEVVGSVYASQLMRGARLP